MYNVYISMVPYNNLYQKMVNKENFLCHLFILLHSAVQLMQATMMHCNYVQK